MDYVILTSGFTKSPDVARVELSGLVNEFLRKGYRPVGGVAIDGNSEGQWLYQAMLNDDPDLESPA